MPKPPTATRIVNAHVARPRRAEPPYRLLAYLHGYPPDYNAGAEWMLHDMLRGLRARGFDVRAVATYGRGDWTFDGVQVAGGVPQRRRPRLVEWADVVLTHLDATAEAITLAGGRPVVHVVHNHEQLAFHRVRPEQAPLVVCNSEWLADRIGWPGRVVVCRPPIVPGRYRPDRFVDERTTLVNMNESKGGRLFWQLAERMPDRPFLGVQGGYGPQVGFPAVRRLDDVRAVPANVELQHSTPNMRSDVYARTRVLIAPSAYESWGRAAVEALACGIPVIAHPTDGLRESLGYAGVFADRANVDAWIGELRRLDDPAEWLLASERALARAAELAAITDADLDALAAELHELVG